MTTRSAIVLTVCVGVAGYAATGCAATAAPARTALAVEEPEQWLAPDEPEVVAATPSITYVKLHEWTPPPQVVELEANVPPRGDAPPSFTSFPQLVSAREVGATTGSPPLVGVVVSNGAVVAPPRVHHSAHGGQGRVVRR